MEQVHIQVVNRTEGEFAKATCRVKDSKAWSKIVKQYPDMWVFITDVHENNGEIESCRLLRVCSHDERAKYIKEYMDSGVEFQCVRTTFSGPNTGIV